MKEVSAAKIKSFYVSFKKLISQKKFGRFLPEVYFKAVLFGLVLTGMQATFLPELVICAELFGEKACDPIGNYVVAITSMPGYLFTGKIMSYMPSAPGYVFFAVLFTLSLIFYRLVGIVIDRKKGKPVTVRDVVFFIIFIALIFLIASLFALI